MLQSWMIVQPDLGDDIFLSLPLRFHLTWVEHSHLLGCTFSGAIFQKKKLLPGFVLHGTISSLCKGLQGSPGQTGHLNH